LGRSSAASFFSQLCNWVAQLLIFRLVRLLFAIIRPPDLKSSGNLCPAPTGTDFFLPRVGAGAVPGDLGLGLFPLLAGEEAREGGPSSSFQTSDHWHESSTFTGGGIAWPKHIGCKRSSWLSVRSNARSKLAS
jgi:hypothetical protein